MNKPLRVGIVGDWSLRLPSHLATNQALSHAGMSLGVPIDCSWLPTPSLDGAGYESTLEPFDALWCAPGSPYQSMQGALNAIQFAREKDWPFIGT